MRPHLVEFQYERLFNTTRIPGEEGDTLLTQSDSTHIVVLYRVVQIKCIGCQHLWFKDFQWGWGQG